MPCGCGKNECEPEELESTLVKVNSENVFDKIKNWFKSSESEK